MQPTLEDVREALTHLAEMNAEQLAQLQADLATVFDEYDAMATTPENVAILQELGNGITSTMSRSEEIAAAEAQAEADKEAARALRQSLDSKPDEGDGGTTDEAGTETVDELEPVTAAGKFRSNPSRMRGVTAPITPLTSTTPRASLVATGFGRGKGRGEVYGDKWELARAMSDTLRSLDRTSANGRVVVASADWRDIYPEERRLGENATVNAQRIEAIVASGGTSLPANVDYGLDVWATPDRPIKGALAQFLADRGALSFRNPSTIAALSGASAVWTEATDANPAGQTKPVLTVTVPAQETVYVNAIPTRLQFGNMMGQFDPETVAANTELALAAAARTAETELQTLIAGAATADITSAQALGASRDFFTTIEKMAANFRYTHRLGANVVLNIMLPEYVKSMIRADRLNELAHDSAGTDPFMISDQWIEDALSLRGIEPIWTLDALPVNGAVYPTQQFSGFAASSAIPTYPTSIVWHVFIKGSVQFLDGGALNLGVVRDATLDATNDYETFVETFEGIANRGFAGGLLQIVSTLTVNGQSSATQVY